MSPTFAARLRVSLIIIAAAIGLTLVFWLPLWLGGGFLGGDVYSYYFPQKVYFAHCLKNGNGLCFWNNQTGFGYPLVGESQTGVFYPLHRVAYFWFDVNQAYNIEHLLHYVLAFTFATLYALRFGMRLVPAMFAAFVYTYSWFPSRCCVEWAIIGGAWLPAALWCCESFLQTRLWRYAIGLSLVLAIQMLAGHFQIAFMTQLLLVAYVPAHLWWATDEKLESTVDENSSKENRWSAAGLMLGAFIAGFGLAAVQLAPTWKLAQHSQRTEPGKHHELEFGSIPVWYWSQAIVPWHWYSPFTDRNEALRAVPPSGGAPTHEIEAHLYFGLLPLGLCLWATIQAMRAYDRRLLFWCAVGLLALFYTTGQLVPLTKHIPGFSFFQGPGRYGIVTTLAVSLLAGVAIDDLLSGRMHTRWFAIFLVALTGASLFSAAKLQNDVEFVMEEVESSNPLIVASQPLSQPVLLSAAVVIAVVSLMGAFLWWNLTRNAGGQEWKRAVHLLMLAAFLATLADLWVVSRLITSSWMVPNPPIEQLEQSPVASVIAAYDQPARLLAPGANFPNVLGCSSLPVYLTFGPSEYVQQHYLRMMESTFDADGTTHLSAANIFKLQTRGVTHLLCFSPLKQPAPVEWLKFAGPDPVLNRVWGRGSVPLYLYELPDINSTIGSARNVARRLRFAGEKAVFLGYSPDRVEIETESSQASTLVLTDLLDKNWHVTVNDKPATPIEVDEMFRSVKVPAGTNRIVWSYKPLALYRGAMVSIATFVILAALAHLRFWHPWLFRARKLSAGEQSVTPS